MTRFGFDQVDLAELAPEMGECGFCGEVAVDVEGVVDAGRCLACNTHPDEHATAPAAREREESTDVR